MKNAIKKVVWIMLGVIVSIASGWVWGVITCVKSDSDSRQEDKKKIEGLNEEIEALKRENEYLKALPPSVEKRFEKIRNDLRDMVVGEEGNILAGVFTQAKALEELNGGSLSNEKYTEEQYCKLRVQFYECAERYCHDEYRKLNEFEETIALCLKAESNERLVFEGTYILKKIYVTRELIKMYREMLMLACDNLEFYRPETRPIFGISKGIDEKTRQDQIDALNRKMREFEDRIDAQKRDIVSNVLNQLDCSSTRRSVKKKSEYILPDLPEYRYSR